MDLHADALELAAAATNVTVTVVGDPPRCAGPAQACPGKSSLKSLGRSGSRL